jgi:hypothetical protein
MSSWSMLRPVRPILIAGAAAIAWLSFSAPAADASTQPAGDSLVGGITASAGSASTSGTDSPGWAAQALKDINAVAPAAQPKLPGVSVLAAPLKVVPSTAPPAPATVPEYVSSLTREVVAPAEAAASAVTSSETLPAQIAAPVVSLAQTTVSRVKSTVEQTVVVPVTETVPILAPPLKSISVIVSDAPALIEPVAPIREVLADVDSAAPVDMEEALPAAPQSRSSVLAESATQSVTSAVNSALSPGSTSIGVVLSPGESVLLGASGSGITTQAFLAVPSSGSTPDGDNNRLEPVLPAPLPGSGSGNGQSSGGPFASAAWLTGSFGHFPAAGLLPARGPIQNVPSPIALEPGSSPD